MDETLRDIYGRIGTVYELTETIPASGQNLDRLTMARQELRNIAQTLKTAMDETGGEGRHG